MLPRSLFHFTGVNLTWAVCTRVPSYHLCVWADESGFLRAGGGRPRAVHRVGGGEPQGLAAAQGGGGEAAFASPAAVVRDAEGTAFVVVQSTACRGRRASQNQRSGGSRSTEQEKTQCVRWGPQVMNKRSMDNAKGLTVTFEPLSDQTEQHLSTVVAEGRGPVRVHVEGVGPNLEVFKCGCRLKR